MGEGEREGEGWLRGSILVQSSSEKPRALLCELHTFSSFFFSCGIVSHHAIIESTFGSYLANADMMY